MRNGRPIVVTVILALFGACSGADKGTGPNGGPVTSVAVGSTSATTVTLGSTISLVAAAYNANGAPVSGQSFIWASTDTLIATVSQSGVVTGVSVGVVSITAAVGTVVGQNTIQVTATTAQLSCSSVTPLSLAVGEVHQFTGLERSSLCLAGANGSEYALIAFNASLDTSTAASSVSFVSTNTAAAVNAPTPQLIAGGGTRIGGRVPRDLAFEQRMREMERRDLNPRIAGARQWNATRSRAISAQRGISAITGVPNTPVVGSLISLNGNATSTCGTPQPHGATIAAVSAHAIVAVDTLSPPNGFTAVDFQNFAATFDTLIFPLDTLNFGAPTDIDGNSGRVLLFFSPLVNQLSQRGSGSYVGGFFFSRDLFPLQGSATLAPCAGSNVGEMFYLPVVDAAQTYNEFFKNKATVTSQLLSTIVHEFQHLINAGRHLYVNTSSTRLEESWLDESQSMLAQELLYYRVSGFAPKQKLTWPVISTGSNANGNQIDFVNAYLVEGLGALDGYLLTPETSTPFNNTETLSTLGAGWQFLRYLLDNAGGSQASITRAIDNGVVTGFTNVQNSFSLSPQVLANQYANWAIAQYVDGAGLTSTPAYSNPSWNYRDVLPRAMGISTGYPLKIRALLPTAPVSVVLRGGAASFIRFRVNAGATAQVTPAPGVTASTKVRYTLVRTF